MPSTYPTDPTFSAKIYWTIPDPVPDSVYETIAEATFGGGGAIAVDPGEVSASIWHLKARHILAWGNSLSGLPTIVNGQIVGWGGCGAPGGIAGIRGGIFQPGQDGGLVATHDAGLAIGAASGVATTTISALGGIGKASGAIGDVASTVLKDIPIVGAVASLALLPLTIVFAHHAAAVAKEQGDICSCSQEINQWLDQIDNAVLNGSVLPGDAMGMLGQLEQQYDQCLSAISAACTPGNINAACDYKAVMHAQVLLRQWIYNNVSSAVYVAPAAAIAAIADPIGSLVSSLLGTSTPGAPAAAGISLSTPMLILLALAALFFL